MIESSNMKLSFTYFDIIIIITIIIIIITIIIISIIIIIIINLWIIREISRKITLLWVSNQVIFKLSQMLIKYQSSKTWKVLNSEKVY